MKFSKKIKRNVAAEPESRKWLWLQLGVGVVMTVVVATLYIFDARDNQVASAPGPAPEGMVWVPGGTFWMGCDACEMPDAAPSHQVGVDGFWMDKTPITNAQFEKFVKATGYKTIAERKPDPKDFPGAPAEKLVPGCAVFTPPSHDVSLDNPYAWWRYVPAGLVSTRAGWRTWTRAGRDGSSSSTSSLTKP